MVQRSTILGAVVLLVIATTIITVAIVKGAPPQSGYVRDKRYVPAHYEHNTTYVDGPCDQWTVSRSDQTTTKTCVHHQQVPVQLTTWVPDKWQLKLQSDDKKKTGWLTVTQTMYNRYDIGNHYPEER